MRSTLRQWTSRAALALLLLSFSACGSISNLFNPYYEPPSALALSGQPNDHALNGPTNDNVARKALEQWGSYQRQYSPQPVNPVLNPAIVRLMWVPDHLNRNGDLVPAHYYYLKVLPERWAVEDAFELEGQLGSASSGGGNLSYVWEGKKLQVSGKKMK